MFKASISGGGPVLEYEFSMGLVSACEITTITVPAQMQLEDYLYHGDAEFKMQAFTTKDLPDCVVTYTCLMTTGPKDIDLCDYSSRSTETVFNQNTGDYTFASEDFSKFGT